MRESESHLTYNSNHLVYSTPHACLKSGWSLSGVIAFLAHIKSVAKQYSNTSSDPFAVNSQE